MVQFATMPFLCVLSDFCALPIHIPPPRHKNAVQRKITAFSAVSEHSPAPQKHADGKKAKNRRKNKNLYITLYKPLRAKKKHPPKRMLFFYLLSLYNSSKKKNAKSIASKRTLPAVHLVAISVTVPPMLAEVTVAIRPAIGHRAVEWVKLI